MRGGGRRVLAEAQRLTKGKPAFHPVSTAMRLSERLREIPLPHRDPIDFEQFEYTVKTTTKVYRNPNTDFEDKNHQISANAPIQLVGVSGINCREQRSYWTSFDVDALVGHAEGVGVSDETLNEVIEQVKSLPWVEARYSKSGRGIHGFVYFEKPVPISSRHESGLLGNAVVEHLTRTTGFDFKSAVDVQGGNMWVYDADAAENAFEIISHATEKFDASLLPPGWREVERSSKVKVEYSGEAERLSDWHKQFEREYGSEYALIWVPEFNCWHLHTKRLEEMAKDSGCHFVTLSEGTDPGQPNAYALPFGERGLSVHRFGNAKEHESWLDGPSGQYALFNSPLQANKALSTFSKAYTKSEGYILDSEGFERFQRAVGLEPVATPPNRQIHVQQTKGVLQVWTERREDETYEEWVVTKRGFEITLKPDQLSDDEFEQKGRAIRARVRAIHNGKDSSEWYMRHDDGGWLRTDSGNVSNILLASGIRNPTTVKGRLRQQAFHLVWKPFKGEYPSRGEWNPGAPQWAHQPNGNDKTSYWNAVFDHVGCGLDEAVLTNSWCRQNGILSGSHYLKLWLKLLLEQPEQKLPYLFLYSPENNSGKSTLGQAVSLLLTTGVKEISRECISDKFNSELEACVLARIEELNLADKNGLAYQTIKRLMTSPTIAVRRMRTDNYEVPNFLHFIHTANDPSFVPLDVEDERIVMFRVPTIESMIEADELFDGLRHQAPSFMRELVEMPLPPRNGRFWLPVLQTSVKDDIVSNQTLHDDLSPGEQSLKAFCDTCANKSKQVTKAFFLEQYDSFCDERKLTKLSPQKVTNGLRKLGFDIKTGKCPYEGETSGLQGKRRDSYVGISLKP